MTKRMDLNMEELNNVAGGRTRGGSPAYTAERAARLQYVRDTYCHANGLGPKHVFEFILCEDDDEIYGYSDCVNCGYRKVVTENPSPIAP